MCVYMYIYMYVCMYVYIHVHEPAEFDSAVGVAEHMRVHVQCIHVQRVCYISLILISTLGVLPGGGVHLSRAEEPH